MIFLRAEIWPDGNPGRSRLLGEVAIYNDETGTDERGNYVVRFAPLGFVEPQRGEGRVKLEGRVQGFRRDAGAAWDLVVLALGKLFGERKATDG